MIFLFFREYKYTREIAAAVVRHLQYRGFDAALVTPEEYNVSLRARTDRVNTWCQQLGKRNVCLVSIHTNAAGNGHQWMSPAAGPATPPEARPPATGWLIASTGLQRYGSPGTSSGKIIPTVIPIGKATSSS